MAISADKPDDVSKLVKRLGLTFPVLSDARLRIAAAYGVRQAEKELALPAVFVTDRLGLVRWRRVGERINERPSVAEILAALRL